MLKYQHLYTVDNLKQTANPHHTENIILNNLKKCMYLIDPA